MVSFFGCVVGYVAFYGNHNYNTFFIIFCLLFLTGILGLMYHIKTLKFYFRPHQNTNGVVNFLWGCNLVFSFTLFSVLIYVLYKIYQDIFSRQRDIQDEDIVGFTIVFIMLVLSVISAIEVSAFYKNVICLKDDTVYDSIEDIKGYQDEEDLD